VSVGTATYVTVLGDGTVGLQERMTVGLRYDPGSLTPEEPADLYYWVPDAEHWVRAKSTVDTVEGLVWGSVRLASRCALFRNRDHTPPRIAFGMHDGDYVPAGGTLTVSIEDPGGVDITERPVGVSLDGVPLSPERVTVSHGRGEGMALVSSSTEGWGSGSHLVTVEAYDTNGNRAEASLMVTITSAFGIAFVANHPNPFWEDTVIALTLTDYADDLTIGLYTLSGRLVRRFRTHGVVGYYEQIWDGMDEDGHPVGNGTYYLKVKAEQGGREVERLSKVSVLR
jgi:hypothetical protein